MRKEYAGTLGIYMALEHCDIVELEEGNENDWRYENNFCMRSNQIDWSSSARGDWGKKEK